MVRPSSKLLGCSDHKIFKVCVTIFHNYERLIFKTPLQFSATTRSDSFYNDLHDYLRYNRKKYVQLTQPAFTCSKSTFQKTEQRVKSVQT